MCKNRWCNCGCQMPQITSPYTRGPGDPRWNSKRGSFCAWTGHCTIQRRSDWAGIMKNREGEEKKGREWQKKKPRGQMSLILITIQAGGADTLPGAEGGSRLLYWWCLLCCCLLLPQQSKGIPGEPIECSCSEKCGCKLPQLLDWLLSNKATDFKMRRGQKKSCNCGAGAFTGSWDPKHSQYKLPGTKAIWPVHLSQSASPTHCVESKNVT